MKKIVLFLSVILLLSCSENKNEFVLSSINDFYRAAPIDVETRWVSAENPTGEKGKGGMANQGAKGDAYTLIAPGSSKVIFNQKGAGIITKIWSANSIKMESGRKVKIEMYWDGEEKPAVSVPFKEFFSMGHGLMRPFESELFSSPEGKSYNCFVPMPYRTGARIEIVNESEDIIMFYYKIDFLKVNKHQDDVLYFHSYWNRDMATELGVDYEILPKVEGKGRYLGTSIGVLVDSIYHGTWFGEGEVKIYLDGDSDYPSLVGTGTEDYIGTGWGQNEFANKFQGSLVSDKENDIYAFYRYHTIDPVYFHKDCKVTIQQIGNSNRNDLRKIRKNGGDFKIIWSYVFDGGMDATKRYLDMENPPKLEDDEFPQGASTNFYRSDDISATAYFYLDKPSNNLPEIQPANQRIKGMAEKVYLFHE